MRFLSGAAMAVWLAVAMSAQPLDVAACEDLATLQLSGVTITSARSVAAGAFLPAAGGVGAASTRAAPRPFDVPRASCRVTATLRPSSDSDISIEVWMPVSAWNGKLQAVGNGAFSGSINYGAMLAAVGRGYATASTDTGHAGGSASFALGHPEKVIDFGWRAVHEMTVVSKKIVGAYYGAVPRFSYWNGCSAGGRQAMKAAQRFPADFDGIIAGAPGLDWTGRAAQAVLVAQAAQKDSAGRMSPSAARLLHRAALDACDALDGVKDGVIGDPARCTFDPGALQCKGAAAADESCLTAAQVSTARLMYSSQPNPKSGRLIEGLYPGSELGWTDMGWSASARATGLDQFRYLVFKDPAWEIARFRFETDIVRAEETDADTINALDPNLQAFIARGGKLIQYHGWSDPQISPGSSVQYYQRVVQAVGAAAADGAYRLFMAPGMAHCGGGDGPNAFDMVGALEQWVEQGRAPDRIVASHATGGVVDRTRPLCPYPQVAAYKGTGSTDEAASFVCKQP